MVREASIEGVQESPDICSKEKSLHSDIPREPLGHNGTVEIRSCQPKIQQMKDGGYILHYVII